MPCSGDIPWRSVLLGEGKMERKVDLREKGGGLGEVG